MKRDALVTCDLDRDSRNTHTQDVLRQVGITDVHVLTVGNYQPTLVMFESARDALKGNEAMRACGWEISRVSDLPGTPPAYWVHHPSPFAAPPDSPTEGRVFPPDSPCPKDVDYIRHQNKIIFQRVDCGVYAPLWRAMREYDGNGQTYSWNSMSSTDNGDGSPLTEVFLPNPQAAQDIHSLHHPAWRGVEEVVTPERLSKATNASRVVDLVYDAVVAAFTTGKDKS